jgi:phytoene dehydrogenase-like protein
MTEALPVAFFFEPDASVMTMLGTLALMHLKAAGYPLGGALELARAIERRYIDLGGEIHYRSRVDKILVEDGRAVGVRLEDGTEQRSDLVISAADGRTTIFDMLESQYVSDDIRTRYDTMRLYSPILFISLGVARPFEDKPLSVAGDVFQLDEPVTIGGREWQWLSAHFYSFAPNLAPAGKTLLRVMLASDYAHWSDLRAQDRARYRTEKEGVADQVIALLDQRYPGLAAHVDMRDVATPATFERYTGNWQGTWLAWLNTPQAAGMEMSNTLPGLDAFYMAGAWVVGGSLPTAAKSGRQVVQMICEADDKPFETAVP